MLFKLILSLLCACSLLQAISSQCADKGSCTECIQESTCAWCTSINQTQNCYNKDKIAFNCPPGNIIDVVASKRVLDDRPIVTDMSSNSNLIRPQRIQLKLRKNEPVIVDLQYGQSHNLPVDLYYLMDLSFSLLAQKKQLADIGDEFVKSMAGITTDFHIGFGSFVDKTDAPFISTKPELKAKPCNNCVPAYSFKNHMPLSANRHRFAEEVRSANVSGNIDIPEGGFDALMQAMVCSKEIGWRNGSRRIIVFATDAPFHVAGDGKLAGIVLPNDARCHMDGDMYTGDLYYDYPSVSHINHVAQLNNFYIMFVVTQRVQELYRMLQDAVAHSRTTLLGDGAAISANIQKFYQELSTQVEMVATPSPNVYVQFATNCSTPDGSFDWNQVACDRIVAGQIVHYKARITARSCDVNDVIRIKPSKLDDTLEIAVRVQCDCACGTDEPNATACGGVGDLHCGVCECHAGFNGKHCECDQSKGEDYLKNDECRATNDTSEENCSGRGSCLCNQCNCDKHMNPEEVISGKYCECDNFSCPKTSAGLCDGQGDCVCGRCVCVPARDGTACECARDKSACMQEGVECSGEGHCECGRCQCRADYFGRYCEACTTCLGGKCAELRSCVLCKAFDDGPLRDECDLQCAKYTINVVDVLTGSVEDDGNAQVKMCMEIHGDCKVKYTIRYDDAKMVADVQKELECPMQINVALLVSSIIAGILLLGLALLIGWKVYTNYKDKLDYARFEEEQQRRKWHRDENPLYKSSTTSFQNPTYGKRESMQLKRRTQQQS